MALDGVVILVIGPVGLIAYIMGLILMMGTWRIILGERFAAMGLWPLLAGLAVSALCTLMLSAVQSGLMYVERLQRYPDLGDFWSIVPGWTLYLYAVLSVMLFVVFVLAVVPLSAVMIRRNLGKWHDFLVALIAGWLIVSFFIWAFPSNQGQAGNRLDHLWQVLQGTGWVIWPILAPYCLAMIVMIRARSRAQPAGPHLT